MAMTIATSANAQFAGGGASKSASGFGSSSATLDPKAHFTSEFRVGSVATKGGFGFNFGGQKDVAALSDWTLAWDFVNVEFAAPFNSPSNLDFLGVKTGLRLFTPSIANDKVRFYTNLSMGYSLALTKGFNGLAGLGDFGDWGDYDWDDDWDDYYDYFNRADDDWDDWDDENFGGGSSIKAHHGFGLTFGVGFQYNKKLNVGYSLQYETAFKTKNHFATIGWTF